MKKYGIKYEVKDIPISAFETMTFKQLFLYSVLNEGLCIELPKLKNPLFYNVRDLLLILYFPIALVLCFIMFFPYHMINARSLKDGSRFQSIKDDKFHWNRTKQKMPV